MWSVAGSVCMWNSNLTKYNTLATGKMMTQCFFHNTPTNTPKMQKMKNSMHKDSGKDKRLR